MICFKNIFCAGRVICNRIEKLLQVYFGFFFIPIADRGHFHHLARIERLVGHPIVRKEIEQARERAARAEAAAAAEPTVGQPKRLTRVNPRGFHALRATFTTKGKPHRAAAGL